jgi:hypothetical protein
MTLKEQEIRAAKLRLVGTPVIVTKGGGEEISSVTRSEPWLMGGHSWMVMVDGVSGGYCVSHVRPEKGVRP